MTSTTSEIQTFNFRSSSIRCQVLDGSPYFCLADAGAVLAMSNPRVFLDSKWCDEEGVRQDYTLTAGGRQLTTFISEANLFAMILRSDKPEALLFHRWVTSEVLPSIRRTGTYSVAPSVEPSLAASIQSLVDTLKAQDQRYQDQFDALRREIDNIRFTTPASTRVVELPILPHYQYRSFKTAIQEPLIQGECVLLLAAIYEEFGDSPIFTREFIRVARDLGVFREILARSETDRGVSTGFGMALNCLLGYSLEGYVLTSTSRGVPPGTKSRCSRYRVLHTREIEAT